MKGEMGRIMCGVAGRETGYADGLERYELDRVVRMLITHQSCVGLLSKSSLSKFG